MDSGGSRAPHIPACHADAADVLRHLDVPFSLVVHVDPDSILYLTANREARTVWLRRDPHTQTLRHRVETGFRVTPPDWAQSSPTSPASNAP